MGNHKIEKKVNKNMKRHYLLYQGVPLQYSSAQLHRSSQQGYLCALNANIRSCL